jgi:hypothetical protein
MATLLSALNPTLMDVARRLDPNGKVAMIVELLSQNNGILADMVIKEANNGTNHVSTVRTGIPSATWRKLYGYTQPAKSTTKQVQDTIGMLEARSQIDKKLAALNGNEAAWRLSEERPFLEGLNQQVAHTLFYGDTSIYPERFMGLSPRFNAASTTKTLSGYNVVKAGGASAGEHTSMWFVVWGENTMHGIYPKGSQAGVSVEDLGSQELTDSNGGRMTVLETKFQWDLGLTVRDWRSIVRICNINATMLKSNTTPADLFQQMTKAYHLQKGRNLGRAVIYCNSTVLTALDVQAQAKTNLMLTYKDIAGEPILTYRGIPIRECEQLLDTEGTIS